MCYTDAKDRFQGHKLDESGDVTMLSHTGYRTFDPAPAGADRSDRLIFLHFEKTGGSTVHTILSRVMDPATIFPDRSEIIRLWPRQDLRRYSFFSVHASTRDLGSIPTPYRIVTFLRDPIDRIISLYLYWRSYKSHVVEAGNLHLPRYAKSVNFHEFISVRSVSRIPRIWNNYTQGLAGDLYIAPSGQPWRSETELLDTALSNLDKFSFVGILEDMQTSLMMMGGILGMECLDIHHRENITAENYMIDPFSFDKPEEVEITEPIRMRLDELTRLDYVIYNRCLDRHRSACDRIGMLTDIPMPGSSIRTEATWP